jgi:hypothetical protein
MRYIRLQQKHGFEAVGRRVKKDATVINKKPATKKKAAPANETDATEGEADEKAAENRDQ